MSNNESNEPNLNLEKSNSNANQIMKLAQQKKKSQIKLIEKINKIILL